MIDIDKEGLDMYYKALDTISQALDDGDTNRVRFIIKRLKKAMGRWIAKEGIEYGDNL